MQVLLCYNVVLAICASCIRRHARPTADLVLSGPCVTPTVDLTGLTRRTPATPSGMHTTEVEGGQALSPTGWDGWAQKPSHFGLEPKWHRYVYNGPSIHCNIYLTYVLT